MPTDGPLVHRIQPAVGSRPDTVAPDLLESRLDARAGHEPGGTDRGDVGWVGEENQPLAFGLFREIIVLFRQAVFLFAGFSARRAFAVLTCSLALPRTDP